MIQWNRVTWYSQILAIVLAIVIFALGFYIGSMPEKSKDIPNIQTERTEFLENKSNVQEKNFIFKGLDTTIRELPSLPSEADWEELIENAGIFKDKYIQDAEKYGDLAKRYHADENYSYYTLDVTEADLTSDGIPERILSFDGGGTYGIGKYEIIEGNKVIATIESPSVGRGGGLLPDKSGNGFSFVWYTEDMFPNGYCCPVAQMVTTFKFAGVSFVAIEEKKQALKN